MRLKERLEARKKDFEASVPKEALHIMHRAVEDLRESGIMDRALQEGDRAPDFTLNDAHGNPVHLQERLADGPVVLGFYRGRW